MSLFRAFYSLGELLDSALRRHRRPDLGIVTSSIGRQMGLRTTKPLNILVVEDNNDFRELLCEMLGMLGHSTKDEASAEHALKALDTHRPDLVITDLTLPGMSGIELATQIHAANPEIKILLSSGYGLPAGAQLDFKVGVLSKPYSLNQLMQALNQISAES